MNSCRNQFFLMSGILVMSISGPLCAELEWTAKPVDAEIEAGEESITQVFKIKNTGVKPVSIQRLQSDCPCVTLSSEQKVLGAGDTARIEAKFEIGDRIGIQRKRITVFTNDDRDSVVPFVWSIKIPEVIRIRPLFLHWKAGAHPTAQRAKVELVQHGAKIKGWSLQKNGFHAEVTEESAGILDVRIRPKSTSVAIQDKFLIEILKADKTTVTYSLRLLVR